jgi:hypothetical protein
MAGAAVAVSVEVVDDLEPSLQANVKEAIAAINNNFFMVFFLFLIVRKTMPFIHRYTSRACFSVDLFHARRAP